MKSKSLTLLILCLFAASCRTPAPRLAPPAAGAKPPAAPARTVAPPQPPGDDLIGDELPLLEPVTVKGSPVAEYERRTFTLNLQSGDVKEVLLALVKDTRVGLIIDPGVSGAVPVMDVKEAALKDILDYMLPPLNLSWEWRDLNLHVFRTPLVTRVFRFDYLTLLRKGKRQVSFSTRSNESGNMGGGGGSGGTSAGGMGGGASGGGSGSGQNQTVNEITVDYQNSVWNTFSESLRTLVFGDRQGTEAGSASGDAKVRPLSQVDATGRSLIVSPDTGLVLVTAYEPELKRVARFIETYAGAVHRQVWIEAKIVEVNLFKGYQMGIDWGAMINRGSSYGTLDAKRTITSPAAGFTPGDVLEQSLSSTYGVFQVGLSNNMVDFLLTAMSRQGNLKVLASPKISAMNNEKAVIRVVREEAFFNLQTQISQSTGGNVTAPNINVQIVPIGIIMDIVPQINDQGDIILSINPDISELLEVKKFEVSGAMATQPVIDRRSIDTVARMRDGQTLVIAGIIKERKNEILRGIPFLSKLPVLGHLFRRTEQVLERNELVIFITPHIMAGSSSDQLTDEEKARIEDAIHPFHLGDVVKPSEGLRGEVDEFKKPRDGQR